MKTTPLAAIAWALLPVLMATLIIVSGLAGPFLALQICFFNRWAYIGSPSDSKQCSTQDSRP